MRRREADTIQEGMLLSDYTVRRDSIIECKADLANISNGETLESFELKSNLLPSRGKRE